MNLLDLYRFEGRMGRMAFALTQIAIFTFSYVAIFLMIVLSGAGDESGANVTGLGRDTVAVLTIALFVNAGWVSVAAAVKRCHDRNLTGWMLLFVMPPLLGQLWLVLSLVTGAGSPDRNRYDPPRKAGEPDRRWAADLSQLDALA